MHSIRVVKLAHARHEPDDAARGAAVDHVEVRDGRLEGIVSRARDEVRLALFAVCALHTESQLTRIQRRRATRLGDTPPTWTSSLCYPR